MNNKMLYKVSFITQGEVYEIYAKSVNQAEIFGFVEVVDLVFGETSKVVVDPAEERLKLEFNHVKKSYIPMHSIVRVDLVDKRGAAKITNATEKHNKVTAFPGSVYTPSSSDKSDEN